MDKILLKIAEWLLKQEFITDNIPYSWAMRLDVYVNGPMEIGFDCW